ncbi:GNAT family N-acetyltransferase [Paenibacillus sp. NPDC057934]|uniref:GNAT family N-acetyltransferase n=1 Tax=Paenibacillus sp. NPDC057934 TaxID=3346282 RepID=UPI0036D9EC0F
MSEVFRQADLKDAEQLVDIIYRAYHLIRELGLHWPAATADLALVQENVTLNECYLLEKDGVILATVTLSKGDEISQRTGIPFVKWFAVDPNYSGQGYGGKLLDWVEEHIIHDRLGASAVTLATAKKHPWLVQMYERRGYERFMELEGRDGDGLMYLLKKTLQYKQQTIQ